ncbi:hypothetical protein L1987_41463 [Smallanthus sonchifolius]|uniref:Uncharacterized protein n=1 Tax=Smallanthus sonchifolius TaxID=185202 RepID=A0ACB9GUY2_9ASTR|nr:hypothetical protein L1987_41463 [Smallanthus sonchifolius]
MAHYPKNTTDLSKIGKETFDAKDDIFSMGRRSKHPSEATAPISRTSHSQGYHYHQYQPQQAYVIQHQLYDAPVAAKVINCNEAAKMYGGTVFVDFPKRKPARRGFFF